ncbi:FAD-dependent oxidoreductase [Streptosporangium sp. OZ121]|uniref:FAD-dependent oxidoreductase n=1 Tax=Streptosporangium sp. OZ121 TaxID=3444183 RepID=UPI003F7A67E2
MRGTAVHDDLNHALDDVSADAPRRRGDQCEQRTPVERDQDWRGRPLLITDAVQARQEVGTPAIIDRAELHRALRGTPPGADEARRQMLSLMADRHPLVTALIEATPPADVYVDPIARLAEPLPSFTVGRIALLGDAAHAMPPDLGQGAGQAFEDAASLTRHLAGAEPADVARRLLRYDAERRPIANRMMRAASRQSRLTSQTGVAAWLRDTLLRAVPSRLATRQLAALWHA